MVVVKNVFFLFLSFFSSKVGRFNLYSDVLNTELAFPDYKNIDLRKWNFFIFPKGLVHGCCQNCYFVFLSFFLFIQNGPIQLVW